MDIVKNGGNVKELLKAGDWRSPSYLRYMNLRELEKVGQHYNKLKHQYDLKKHELDMIHERLQTTRHHQLAQEVEEMENQNQQLQNDLKEAKLLQDQGSNKMKETYQSTA